MRESKRDYITLLDAYSHGKPDKTDVLLRRLGVFCFTAAISLNAALIPIEDQDSLLYIVLVSMMGVCYFGGLFALITKGIHYVRRSRNKSSFLSAAKHVLGRTFLYIFLPALIITVLLVVLAIVVAQPDIQ